MSRESIRPDPRWLGIRRDYSVFDVEQLRGSVRVEHTLARLGAERLWKLLNEEPYVPALGALSGNQAMQMVKAGLKAIYLSGWQVAADANDSLHMYPDQSLYAVSSVPTVVKRINNALLRADQIQTMEGKGEIDWLAPIVADAESGFGGVLNAFELMKSMIEAGAAGVHFEDQLASEKKCGHLGGKVLVPVTQFIRTLTSARLDVRLHDLERVERPTEAGLGVGHDRGEPVRPLVTLGMGDLVGAQPRVVDPAHHRRHRVRRVEALVGVGVPGEVGVRRDLPAGQVDRLQARLDHLHGLAARERAECRDPLALLEERAEPLCAEPRERVLHAHRAAQALDVLGRVGAGRFAHRGLLLDPDDRRFGS